MGLTMLLGDVNLGLGKALCAQLILVSAHLVGRLHEAKTFAAGKEQNGEHRQNG